MGYSIDRLSIGQKASFAKTITETDICLFAGVSGDINPAHLNEQYASQTFFKGRILIMINRRNSRRSRREVSWSLHGIREWRRRAMPSQWYPCLKITMSMPL